MFANAAKKQKTEKTPPELGANTGVHDMEEKNIVDEVEPATLRTMRDQHKTTMSKNLKRPVSYASLTTLTSKNWRRSTSLAR